MSNVQIRELTLPGNTRIQVPAGTRVIEVVVSHRTDVNQQNKAEFAVKTAFQAARRSWGKFEMDQVEYSVYFFTLRILVEVRLIPREPVK